MYYIISLYHTQKRDKYITLWRPDNAGYCYSREKAGIYNDPEDGYHDSDHNMPVSIGDASRLFVTVELDGCDKMVIFNCDQVRKILGLKQSKHGLTRV